MWRLGSFGSYLLDFVFVARLPLRGYRLRCACPAVPCYVQNKNTKIVQSMCDGGPFT